MVNASPRSWAHKKAIFTASPTRTSRPLPVAETRALRQYVPWNPDGGCMNKTSYQTRPSTANFILHNREKLF